MDFKIKNKKVYLLSGIALILILMVVVAFALLAGGKSHDRMDEAAMQQEQQILYYTCGMHPSVRVSPQEYKKGSVNCPICNMKLVPVYKEEGVSSKEEREILFYRNPMNPSITSKVPAKDEMGMDYIPVYKESESAAGQTVTGRVRITGEQLELAGIQTEPLRKLSLYKQIRTVGTVAYDPHLVVAEEEYIASLRALDKIQESPILEIRERAENLVTASKRKLNLLGLSDEQILELKNSRAPHSNLILPEEKMWVYADVYEYELSWLKPGAQVLVTTASLPGEEFTGNIASLNPVLNPKTRTLTFRVEIENPELKLKPQMYVDVVIKSVYLNPAGESMVLAVPKNAVLDTGLRRIVWVEKRKGEFEGREVVLGPEASALVSGKEANFFPVLKGLSEGEFVVTKANFLIDSQSQITGVAASAYGGALAPEEKSAGEQNAPASHQH
jgi:Cu(I)/Ag(I) efflux system membrane fusion protein